MPSSRTFSEIRLVNGSIGDPALFIDYPGKNDAYLFDAGENCRLDTTRLGDLCAVFITHHHVDHFIGFDRIVRANLDQDKSLSVYGPEGTIQKVYDRIKSYEHPFFPFQKLVIKVHELVPGILRSALLECTRHFPEPEIREESWTGPVLYENADLQIEAAFSDHTVPCLAFALVEKSGYHPDPAKLAAGPLRPGDWVGKALEMLREGQAAETMLTIKGHPFALSWLEEQYFSLSRGARVAYVTDTVWSEAVRPGLIKLANKAQRLYCDSYYAPAQAKQAALHKHMTADCAAELARLAKVEELILMHFAPRYAGRYEQLVEEARAIFPKASADLT
ncbi:MAG: MBL fold metallo-hydrolase [Gemmataceae bacterium]